MAGGRGTPCPGWAGYPCLGRRTTLSWPAVPPPLPLAGHETGLWTGTVTRTGGTSWKGPGTRDCPSPRKDLRRGTPWKGPEITDRGYPSEKTLDQRPGGGGVSVLTRQTHYLSASDLMLLIKHKEFRYIPQLRQFPSKFY